MARKRIKLSSAWDGILETAIENADSIDILLEGTQATDLLRNGTIATYREKETTYITEDAYYLVRLATEALYDFNGDDIIALVDVQENTHPGE